MRVGTRSAQLVAISLVLVGAASGAGPDVVYFHSPDAVIVEFAERPGEVAGDEAVVSLRIYGDGRFVAQRPPGMRRAGEQVGRLTRAELQALLRRMADRGVLDFDSSHALRRARSSRGRLAVFFNNGFNWFFNDVSNAPKPVPSLSLFGALCIGAACLGGAWVRLRAS